MMRKLMLVVILLSAVLLAGCHTWKGFGQDIESGGAAIERSSGK